MRKHLAPRLNLTSGIARLTGTRTRKFALSSFVLLVSLALLATSLASPSRTALSLSRYARVLSAPLGSLPVAPASLLQAAQTPANDSLNVGRQGHTATPLADGKILFVGGENESGAVAASEIYDPNARTFTVAASLTTARTEHTATTLADGRVLITGGRNQADILDSTEIYDPATNSFTEGARLNQARAGHSATQLADGKILIAGGDTSGSAEIFDPQAQTFNAVEEHLAAVRARHSAVLLPSGKVFLTGGIAPEGNAVQSGEIFDPATQSFVAVSGAMNTPRVRPLLRVLPDGKVQLIGGNDENSIEIYDPATDEFGAYAHLLPASNPLADILRTQTRAALFHRTQNGTLDPSLDRDANSLTEIPQTHQALVAGGVNSGGQSLKSISVLDSSDATITTDQLDYAPGTPVVITGTGWQPGETVTMAFHEEPTPHDESALTAVADSNGNFTNTDFTPEVLHHGVAFVLTAKGQTSNSTAQTSFTDAGGTRTRVSVASVFRVYGQSISLRATLCIPITDGTGTCNGIDGQTVAFTLNGVSIGSATTQTENIGGVLNPGIATINLPDIKNAGGYTIIGKFNGDDTYALSSGTAALTIGKVTPTVTWNFPANITYGTPLSSTQLNATAADNTVASQFTGTTVAGGFVYTPPAGTVQLAGTSQSISGKFNPTNLVNYSTVTRFVSINVAKAPLTVTPDSIMRGYANANPTLTGTVNGIVNNDPITVSYATTATPTSPAGDYDITATLADPLNRLKNYNVTINKGTLSVGKIVLTVKADDKSRNFGADNPPFTYTLSGFVNGETATTPGVISGTPSLSSTAVATSPAGTYPIQIAPGTLTSANYSFNLVAGALTVARTQSTLILSNLIQTYDGTPKPVTATTNPPGLSGVFITYDGAEQAPTNAGSYQVDAVLKNESFESAEVLEKLVIQKANQTIDFPALADHTFGDPTIELIAKSTSGLPVTFSVVSGNAVIEGSKLAINGAGQITVRASQSGDANYNAATDVVQTFNVAKASVTITLNPASLQQTYDGSPKFATASTNPPGINGVRLDYGQNGEAVASPLNAGSYAVTASLTDPNFEALSVAGTLVIAKATATVTATGGTFTYDGLPHLATGSVVGVNGEILGVPTFIYTPEGLAVVAPDTTLPETTTLNVPPAPEYKQLNEPPANGHSFTVFPSRDFISVDGYRVDPVNPARSAVTVNVLRKNEKGVLVTVGSVQNVIPNDADGDGIGVVEVNHPGGGCWDIVTPDIQPGDIVRITDANGIADQTTVANVTAERPVWAVFQPNDNTIVIHGTAQNANGQRLPLAQLEERIVVGNTKDRFDNGRRDLRAPGANPKPGDGSFSYDVSADPASVAWTATYTHMSDADAQKIIDGESRILWLGTDLVTTPFPESTIFEIGDLTFPGPSAPCSAPLEGTTPPGVGPVPAAPAYTTLNEPPVGGHSLIVFPSRDFITASGYAPGQHVTISVFRHAIVNGLPTADFRTVGYAEATANATGVDAGAFEVNHPGASGCWIGATPDIRTGDIVRVTDDNGVADQTTVANVTAERPVVVVDETTGAKRIVIHGTAQDASGAPLPIAQLEERLIARNDLFNFNGRRDLRSPRDTGAANFQFDAPGSIHWTVTYTGLGASDITRALKAESRIHWLGTDIVTIPAPETTIFEIGDTVANGPQTPCSAASELSGVPVYAGTYDVLASFAGNDNYLPASATTQIIIQRARSGIRLSPPISSEPTTATASVKSMSDVAVEGAQIAAFNAAAPVDVADAQAAIDAYNNSGAQFVAAHTNTRMSGSFFYDSEQAADAGLIPRPAEAFAAADAQPTVTTPTADATPELIATFDYDGKPHPVEVTLTGINGVRIISSAVTITYARAGSNESPTTDAPVNAGTYDVVATYGGGHNYTGESATGQMVINKLTPTMTASGGTFTYDGQAHPASGSIVGLNGASVGTPTFTYNGASDAPVNAGSYAVVASFAGNVNYNAVPGISTSIVINKAQATISLSNLNYTYDASPKSVTANTSPADLSGVAITYNDSPTRPTDAGQYRVVASLANPNYEASNALANLLIGKATPSFSNLSSPTIIYQTPATTFAGRVGAGSLPPSGNVSITVNGATQSVALQSDGSFSTTITTGGLVATSAPYVVSYSFAGNSNFNGASGVGKLTVNFNTSPDFDQTKAFKSGSTAGIRVQLRDANGVNVSSRNVALNCVGVRQMSNLAFDDIAPTVTDPTDTNFHFEGSDTDGRYSFNLKTDGYSVGTYLMSFTVGSNPTVYTVQFQVR
jgi:hypothetical protein